MQTPGKSILVEYCGAAEAIFTLIIILSKINLDLKCLKHVIMGMPLPALEVEVICLG